MSATRRDPRRAPATADWPTSSTCSVEQTTTSPTTRMPPRSSSGVLIYDGERLRKEPPARAGAAAVEAELARALTDGPGIVVFDRGVRRPVGRRPCHGGSSRRSSPTQRAAGGAAGDHFAKAGQNDRIWNALEKLALRDPGRVRRLLRQRHPRAGLPRPGSAPATRSPRRSTSSTRAARRRPRTATTTWASIGREVARGSRPMCTGCRPCSPCRARSRTRDMPAETGPTMYLPHSQKYLPGYLAWRRPEFREYFEATTSSCRWPRATRRSSTRRCSMRAGANRTADVQPHGQPAAGVVGVRPGHGGRRPDRDVRRRVPGAAGHGRDGGRRRR